MESLEIPIYNIPAAKFVSYVVGLMLTAMVKNFPNPG